MAVNICEACGGAIQLSAKMWLLFFPPVIFG